MLYDYYCRPCADSIGRLTDIYVTDPLESSYQVGKFAKHTTPPSTSITEPLGIFTSTSTDDYTRHVQQAATFGVVEITPWGRRNFICPTPQAIGVQYQPRGPILLADCVRTVLSSGERLVHAYPDIIPAAMCLCAACRSPLL
jgi:hypothetical protein